MSRDKYLDTSPLDTSHTTTTGCRNIAILAIFWLVSLKNSSLVLMAKIAILQNLNTDFEFMIHS